MNMSDKDFDQLFQVGLADMKIEPSADVWSHITDELDGKKRTKGAGLPFMQIAAGIVVLMGISLFFLRPNTEKIPLHAYAATTINTTPEVKAEDVVEATVYDTTKPSTLVAAVVNHPVKHQQKRISINTAKQPIITGLDSGRNVPTIAATTTGNVSMQPLINSTRKVAGDVDPPATQSGYIAPLKPVNTLAAATAVVSHSTQDANKHKKIRSLGDILNVVIAKVDKREDKIIEFTNDNDDESFNITGVNLGLFKAKKEK